MIVCIQSPNQNTCNELRCYKGDFCLKPEALQVEHPEMPVPFCWLYLLERKLLEGLVHIFSLWILLFPLPPFNNSAI